MVWKFISRLEMRKFQEQLTAQIVKTLPANYLQLSNLFFVKSV